MSYNSSTEANCVCSEDIKKDEESNFDLVLKEKWMEAQKNEVFRYILNIQDSKILEGKYHFLVQLNIDRGYKRRSPESIISMNQPFNEKDFNFTKLVSEEQIMNLNNTDKDDIIAINASPIEYCHSLLLPQRCKQLPQLVTKHSLVKAVELFSLSLSSYIRVAFNSLCAFASVNHLHWHLYYLKWRMLLEYIDVEKLRMQLSFTFGGRNFHNVSLDQGQEPIAEETIELSENEGHWVSLQNVHLVRKWLPALEKKMEQCSKNPHDDYRLFIRAEPSPDRHESITPQGILKSAIKITNEPPSEIQANIHKA
ncbi:GDP-D-glucose phosphorylase 1-like isoform X1 [Bombus terrestris]|uniref:GDP-D-glucose phosphorylase 1-like isoform X1 n=2 Tax=Bombus terrestris TaxID=30195 RepID=A0A9C6WEW9_BOMTE|nr:GDP-D-glucose phosphorylase 1-like isoform X1 [Bombus terrestris]XP_048269836.1 GDP-D-glucose phosphorylase 1-like isoform X1 [Bombus terrestris]